jgi:hypothetical protein
MKLLKASLSILLLFLITIVKSQDYTPKYSPETCITYFKKLYVPLSEGEFEHSKYQEDVKICQECLSCYPSVILNSRNKKTAWTANNKQLKLSFDVIPGGIVGQKYDVMKGKLPIGIVEKTGKNLYKFTTKFKDYAFKGDEIEDKYVALIKNSINTEMKLYVNKIKGGTAIFILSNE